MNFITEYTVGLNPSRVVVSPVWDRPWNHRTHAQFLAQHNLEENSQGDAISRKTHRKILLAVSWLLALAESQHIYVKSRKKTYPFRVGFVTLTIPEQAEKPSIAWCNQNLLLPCLKSLRKYYGMEHYVWKAETQRNGMVHYHITTTSFIPYDALLKIWNRLLSKCGVLNSYKRGCGQQVPNSVDTRGVKYVRNLPAYLAKYFSKPSTYQANDNGRKWGLSTSISFMLTSRISIMPDAIQAEITPIEKETGYYTSYKGLQIFYAKSDFRSCQGENIIKNNIIKVIEQVKNGTWKDTCKPAHRTRKPRVS